MTVQITNTIDAGITYERILRLIERIHGKIRVVVTEKLSWNQKETTTIMEVENQEEATQVQRLLCQEIGGKEIAVKLSLI